MPYSFTLDDFRKQMAMIAKPSLMQKMMGMLPFRGEKHLAMDEFDESEINRLFGIIDSMTPAEKADVKLIDQGRRRRIAAGAGVEPRQVNEVINMYVPMAQMVAKMAGKGIRERMKIFSHPEDPYRFPGDDEDENSPPDSPPSA